MKYSGEGKPFTGVVVPMITPFTPAGEIDDDAIARIVDHLIQNRIGGIFPLGTTGEAASIPALDKLRVVETTVKSANRRAMIYAGISGNCLRDSIAASVDYQELGVDALVAHMPSYYPLNDAEIETHFLKLADSVPLPLVLYNIPVTTHHHISLDVVDRLRKHQNIVAIKDSANDGARLAELLKRSGGRGGWPVLVGTSTQFTHGLKMGAVGMVPSGAHLVPDLYQHMYESAMKEQWGDVERLQRETDGVCSQYLKGKSLGEGLAVLKALLEKKGLCGRTMLPPLRDHVGDV